MKRDVVVMIGAGGIGTAIARRQGFGKTVLLADFNEKALQAAAESLRGASYAVETRLVDVSSRESVRSLARAAASLGNVVQVVNTAGLSPNMASRRSSTAAPCTSRTSSGISRRRSSRSTFRAR